VNRLYDVIVVGAGPGGSAAAERLARAGLEVLLVDRAEFPRGKTCGDALTPRAINVVRDLGLLNELEPRAARASGLRIVGPNGSVVSAPFPGFDPHALVVPRVVLDDVLLRCAIRGGAHFEGSVVAHAVLEDESGVRLHAERHGQSFTAGGRAAIIATGVSTGLLKRSGFLERTPAMALAARAYYEHVADLGDRIQLRFDNVPLPGYGWIFPLPDGRANVGAGVFPVNWGRRTPKTSGLAVFDAFTRSKAVRAQLAGSRRSGEIKGYPIRTDFGRSRVVLGRRLLVGEAAGLVNPLTGEGIDYALESGQLAAEYLSGILARGDVDVAAVAQYQTLLRERFRRLFTLSGLIRDVCVNRLMLDRMVAWAERRPDLKMRLVNLVFGKPDEVHEHPTRANPSPSSVLESQVESVSLFPDNIFCSRHARVTRWLLHFPRL
jgi:menaquinone-9 beta-reductase